MLKLSQILLASYLLADPTIDAVADSVLKSITTSRDIVHLFKEQSNFIKTDEFKEFLQKLDHFQSLYSFRDSEHVDEIKTLMYNAMVSYFMSSQRIYEWCGLIVHHLESYFNIGMDGVTSKATVKMQQHIMIEILDVGLEKLAVAHEKLNKASQNFNKAYGSITELVAQLNTDFDPNGDFVKERVQRLIRADENNSCNNWFCNNGAFRIRNGFKTVINKLNNIKRYHEELKNAIGNADAKINETKAKLQNEIIAVGDGKSQAMITLATDTDELDKEIQMKIYVRMKELIEESRGYRERHTDQRKTFFEAREK